MEFDAFMKKSGTKRPRDDAVPSAISVAELFKSNKGCSGDLAQRSASSDSLLTQRSVSWKDLPVSSHTLVKAKLDEQIVQCIPFLITSGQRVVVFDVETSGLSHGSRVVEFGAVELVGTARTGKEFRSLVNGSRPGDSSIVGSTTNADGSVRHVYGPGRRYVHDPESRRIHGISEEDEAAAPSFDAAYRAFLTFLLGFDPWLDGTGTIEWPILVAHNAPFDVRMINSELDTYFQPRANGERVRLPPVLEAPCLAHPKNIVDMQLKAPRSLCSRILFRKMFPSEQNYSLDGAAKFCDVSTKERDDLGRHSALADSRQCCGLFLQLLAIIADGQCDEVVHA